MSHKPRTTARSRVVPHSMQSRDTSRNMTDEFNILDTLVYGKVAVEVINERLGNMVADLLAEWGTAEAEMRKMMDEIQDEVAERARKELIGSGSVSRDGRGSGSSSSGAELPLVEEDEAVDTLRAEIASTRSLIQQVRMQKF
jgi:hypothetical protein